MNLNEAEFKEEVRLLKVAQENESFYKYPGVMVVEAAILLAEDGPKSASLNDLTRL